MKPPSRFEALVASLPDIEPCPWCGRCVLAGPACCDGMKLGGEIVKTFNFGRWSWAIVRDKNGQAKLFRKTNGEYRQMDGTSRAARDCYSWAKTKWPEYLE